MIKIKRFRDYYESDPERYISLDGQINEFCSDNNITKKKFIDIKFSTSGYGSYNIKESALLIYEE